MGLIGRGIDLIRAKSNEWLHGKEKNNAGARAQEAADQIQKDTADLTTGAAQAIAQLEAVKDQKKAADAEVEKWQKAAVKFNASGDKAAAKQALERKISAQDLANKLQQQIDAQQARIDSYRQKAQDMQSTARDAQNTAEAIKAREKVVKAEENIKSADPNAALNKLKDAEADVTARERTQTAINEMDGSDLEARARKLDKDSKLEEELAKLEAASNPAAAPSAPGANPGNGHSEEWNVVG
ncbi:MAG: hypothetical protein FJX76_05210 [Armatimonadetes bacterium]|nr:hypothetical protein [Armatimonadota bacterium]